MLNSIASIGKERFFDTSFRKNSQGIDHYFRNGKADSSRTIMLTSSSQLSPFNSLREKGRAITARPALRNDDALGGVGVEDYFGPAVVAVVEVFVGVGGFG